MKSLSLICDELHITNLESLMHKVIGGIYVEEWCNLSELDFKLLQSQLDISQKKNLELAISEIVGRISG